MSDIMIDLGLRHVLVVGGTGTIGSAVAAMASARGAQVTATGRSVEDRSDEGRVSWRSLDVTDARAVEELIAELDVSDIVVAAAARPFASLADMSQEDLTALVDSRLWGAFHIGRAAAGRLRDGGTLTFISGTLASYPDSASPVAAVSAGVEVLACGLAVELAPIRVNVISPAALGSKGRGEHEGQADDVAHAIVMAIQNPWMSGSVIALHGAGKP